MSSPVLTVFLRVHALRKTRAERIHAGEHPLKVCEGAVEHECDDDDWQFREQLKRMVGDESVRSVVSTPQRLWRRISGRKDASPLEASFSLHSATSA